MASETDIANLALSKLGDEDQIPTIDADTKAARAIKAVFVLLRDAVLRAHPWNFAMTRASLPALEASPAFGYERAFQLPSDFVRIHEVVGVDDYQVEGQQILTDAAAPLRIRYVRRVTDAGAFDPLFVEALAARIAWQCCERITGSADKKSNADAEYRAAIAEARRVDGQENPPEEPPASSWLTSREGS